MTPIEYIQPKQPFAPESIVSENLFAQITDVRVQEPELIGHLADARKRRARLAPNGRLALLAADHPARKVTSAGDTPSVMADRLEYLGRITRALQAPGIDGIMATADIIEELLLLDHFLTADGAPSFMNDKVLVGSGNRTGLKDARFELDDRWTGYNAEWIETMRLDGLKILIRIDLDHYDSVATLARMADEVLACQARGIPAFVEILPGTMGPNGFEIERTAEALMDMAGIASALGGTSALTWLKLPWVPEYERVARSTTLPILMLGGDTKNNPIPMLQDFALGMTAGPAVRGVMVGRNVLFPGQEDPYVVAGAVARIVHDGISAAAAIETMYELREQTA